MYHTAIIISSYMVTLRHVTAATPILATEEKYSSSRSLTLDTQRLRHTQPPPFTLTQSHTGRLHTAYRQIYPHDGDQHSCTTAQWRNKRCCAPKDHFHLHCVRDSTHRHAKIWDTGKLWNRRSPLQKADIKSVPANTPFVHLAGTQERAMAHSKKAYLAYMAHGISTPGTTPTSINATPDPKYNTVMTASGTCWPPGPIPLPSYKSTIT